MQILFLKDVKSVNVTVLKYDNKMNISDDLISTNKYMDNNTNKYMDNNQIYNSNVNLNTTWGNDGEKSYHREAKQNIETAALVLLVISCVFGVIGVTGNAISVRVWTKGRTCSKLACKTYFILLSSTDIVVLLVSFPLNLLRAYPLGRPYFDRFCPTGILAWLLIILYDLGPIISPWITVCICVERALSLCFPFKFLLKTAGKRAKVVFCVVFLILLFLSITQLHFLFPNLYSKGYCKPEDIEHQTILIFMHYREWLLCYLPFIIITICNFAILIKICRTNILLQQQKRPRRRNGTFTALCIATGALQCISILPTAFFNACYLYGALDFILEIIDGLASEVWLGVAFWTLMCNFTIFLNNCLNFILYCFTGKRFRSDVKQLFWCK